ncbi:uncharacterized protein FIBRA_04533 [Fibroporia radiculosa]|uniref:V-type proton ATPase subunit G n=1 Tax=Fibroporia radiculosa TaxID=599839 RepID=J4H305_9APHY|nr:uncharacterized protein FIBRA_04533 [Fibroporia radiculosa]CCM02434.1 predicted protein [Fibroporia radiculosa]
MNGLRLPSQWRPVFASLDARRSPNHSCLLPMAAQQSQSIQTLLEAEKEAAKVVQQARQYRVQKLKDAHLQATKEIEEYKRAKEEQIKAFEASHAGSTQSAQATIDRETQVQLKEISELYYKNKDDVVQKLLGRVVLVNPELHRNLKKQP